MEKAISEYVWYEILDVRSILQESGGVRESDKIKLYCDN